MTALETYSQAIAWLDAEDSTSDDWIPTLAAAKVRAFISLSPYLSDMRPILTSPYLSCQRFQQTLSDELRNELPCGASGRSGDSCADVVGRRAKDRPVCVIRANNA